MNVQFRASLACAVTLLFGCSEQNREEAPAVEHVVTVDVGPVLTSNISLKITGDALLFPLQQAALIPKIAAPVRKFFVERGSRVGAGQLLAELENRDLAGAVAESRAALEQAEANYQATSRGTAPEELQRAELDARTARDVMDAQQKLFDSRQSLYREGAIAQKEVNDAQVALTQAKNQYEAAVKHLDTLRGVSNEQSIKALAAQRDAAKARLEGAEAQYGYSRIVSPIDGIVTDRPLYAGEMPQSGSPIVVVMDLSEVIARAHISQNDAKRLKIGNPAALLPPDSTEEVPGKVTVISPALDPASTTVEVWVRAPNPAMRLRPGSGVRVEIIAQTVENTLTIPADAVITGPSGDTSVIAVNSDNKPAKKSVTLGIRDGRKVQVTDGLQSGERVVIAGAYELAKLEDEDLAKTKVQVQAHKEEDEDKK